MNTLAATSDTTSTAIPDIASETAGDLGMILVISGPSGVGKDTVWKAAAPKLPTFARAITCTTRERRDGEIEGVTYYYVPNEEFERMIEADELIEWAKVHGNCYGVPQSSVLERINKGLDVVCVIDVQGAKRIKALFPNSILVFIKPVPGKEHEVLEQRIQGRGEVDPSELKTRLQTATWELSQVQLYDYQIINDDLERAAEELISVVAKERLKHLLS